MIIAEFTNSFKDLQVNSLYQWDINQTLKISGINFGTTAVKVHFCNKKSENALVVNSTIPSGGAVTANIPNSLLQEPYDIIAYVYQTSGTTSNTIKSIRIPVIARQKPNDYSEPTADEIIEIHEIELEAKAIIDNLTASAYNASESYKRPNIVYYRNGAYMCKSSTAVTGVEPTDSTVWQLLCEGTYISGVNVDSATNRLVFTFSNGGSVSIPVESAEVEDGDNINITVASAKKIITSTDYRGGDGYKVPVAGLYACTIMNSESYYFTIMLSLPDLVKEVYSYGAFYGGSLIHGVVYYPSYKKIRPTHEENFSLVEVRLITAY